VKIKKNKKMSFFLSCVLVIGSIIGAGIFIKNEAISNYVDGESLT